VPIDLAETGTAGPLPTLGPKRRSTERDWLLPTGTLAPVQAAS